MIPIPTFRDATSLFLNSLVIVFTLEVLLLEVSTLSCTGVHHRHEWLERHELLLWILAKTGGTHIGKTTRHHAQHWVRLLHHWDVSRRLSGRELARVLGGRRSSGSALAQHLLLHHDLHVSILELLHQLMMHGHLLQEVLLLSFELNRVRILVDLEGSLQSHHHGVLLAHSSQKRVHHELVLLWGGVLSCL